MLMLWFLLIYKKAFDAVDHDIFLSKMNLYRIQGIALDWFKSYLTNRTQRCLVNGFLSRICSLKCRVPQGKILGPLLFLIYINDLPNCLTSCQRGMHADCCNCGKTLIDSLQKLQNRDARVLTLSRYDADANHLFRQLNWKDLRTQFRTQKTLMVYKSLNDLVPGYLSSKFVKRHETRYSLKDSVNKLIVLFPRTNFMKNSFS